MSCTCFKMIWILTLLSQLIFGFYFAYNIIPVDDNIIFAFGLGIPIGFSTSSFLFFFLSAILGQNIVHIFINIGTMVAATIFIFFMRLRKVKLNIHLKYYDLIYPIFCLIASFAIFYFAYFPQENKLPCLTNVYLQEDIAIESSFYNGINSGFLNPFSLKHPLLYGKKITTRWLPAFHSSMLRLGYCNLKLSLVIPSALMFTSFCLVMQNLFKRLNLPFYLGYFAPFIAYSVSGFYYFNFYSLSQHNSKAVDYITKTAENKDTHFLHPHLQILFGCRSAIWCSSIVIAVITSLFTKRSKLFKTSIFFFAGLILPSTLLPAFYCLILFLVLFSIMEIKIPFIFLLLGSLLNMHRIFSISVGSHSIWEQWTLDGTRFPSFHFFFYGYGFFFIISVISLFLVVNKEKNTARSLFVCLILFFNISFYQDTQKNQIILYAFFIPIATAFYALAIYRLAKTVPYEELKGVIAALGLIITIIMCTSSTMGTLKMIKVTQTVFNDSDKQLTEWINKNTKTTDVFFAPRLVFEPISTLGGRQVLLPSKEVADVCNFKVTSIENEIEKFIENSGNKTIFPMLNYIVRPKSQSLSNFNYPDETEWTEVHFTSDVVIYMRGDNSS